LRKFNLDRSLSKASGCRRLGVAGAAKGALLAADAA
jgi:hypothetical protein